MQGVKTSPRQHLWFYLGWFPAASRFATSRLLKSCVVGKRPTGVLARGLRVIIMYLCLYENQIIFRGSGAIEFDSGKRLHNILPG